MAEKEWYHEIDVLRGLTIFAMIVIHASVYFQEDKTAYFLWDLLQFAVPVFLFCSAYISFKRNQTVELSKFPSYIGKRLKRLLFPYWIFLLFYVPLVYFYDSSQMTMGQILRFATLTTSGNDVSWLVLLFAMSAVLIPFMLFLNKKHIVLFWTFGTLSFVGSIFLLVFQSPVHFKLMMWFPWTLMFYFTWYFAQEENSKERLIELFITTTILYAFLFYWLPLRGNSIVHYENKYPPNLFHLSYGMSWIVLLYYLAKKKVFALPGLKQLVSFLSRRSYSIYFIHFLILYVMTTYYKGVFLKLAWWQFFAVLFVSSVSAQLLMGSLRRVIPLSARS